MPFLRVSVRDGRIVPGGPGVPVGPDAALRATLDAASTSTPIVIMIHGYRFAPGVPGADPHARLFSAAPSVRRSGRLISWPRHMGFRTGTAAEGVGIGFGWPARGTLWQAARAAEDAARALARLIARLDSLTPGRPVDILAHSMGARVALTGVATASRGTVGRMILLSAADYPASARAALAAPAAAGMEVFNVTSRENDAFDFLLERLLPASEPGARALGQGLRGPSNWLDLPIDDAAALTALARIGHRIAPPRAIVCHWSSYLRPGAFPFYRRLLHDRAALPLPMLRAALPDAPAAPRWSRLRTPRPTPPSAASAR